MLAYKILRSLKVVCPADLLDNIIMRVFHSVRTRIILISTLLLALFLIAYTVTVWAIANSYALESLSQTNSFSLSMISSEIDSNTANVRALVTRVAIDNELKNILSDFDQSSWIDYYHQFESMIQSNPAFNVIDRFIITDSSMTHFLQVVGYAASTGRPLRQGSFLDEAAHVPADSGFSDIYASTFSYESYNVTGSQRSIIDYNTGRTIGYVFATINIDALFENLRGYQELNGEAVYFCHNGEYYLASGDDFTYRPELSFSPSGARHAVLNNGTSIVTRLDDGSYMLYQKSQNGDFDLLQVFSAPSILGSFRNATFILLFFVIGFVVLVIALILSLYLNKAIYQPVKKLSKRIEKIQQSDFSQDNSINTDDEFGMIGRGINKLSSEVTDLMDRRVEDERKKIELEYKMLESQINPHFLYNTFNSIKWMATIQGASGIGEMITSLSRLMKNISKRDESLWTLSEELSFIDDYFVIMKYRYGNTISYCRSLDDECRDIMIPRFTLQPLVENAIFHGIEPKGTGAIAIMAKGFQSHYSIMVADNGVGFDSTEEKDRKADGVFRHIGVDNIRQRLSYALPGRVSFSVHTRIGVGTACIIRIAKEEK